MRLLDFHDSAFEADPQALIAALLERAELEDAAQEQAEGDAEPAAGQAAPRPPARRLRR